MFRTISDFVAEITGGGRHPETFADGDYRLAAAALLVHMASLDQDFDDEERSKIKETLVDRFELKRDEADTLVAAALEADRKAVDLYHFTSVLNHALDDDGRKRIIEMMFEVAYVDGKLSEFEDNVVWRASELLNVSPRERVELRRRVRDERES
ncbi:MAG TPA: TerB family tellurite resistance protein [Xanthobacteraceae bacterium]|nr:TerB family tellurite resistance protein [Xanthobacteraceae bacterium]